MITATSNQTVAIKKHKPDFDEFSLIENENTPEVLLDLEHFGLLPDETINAYLGKIKRNPEIVNTNLSFESKYRITALEQEQEELRKDFPIPLFERPIEKKDMFLSLQKWEGYVLEINKDNIIAQLIDLNLLGNKEIAEIPKQEISSSDFDLLREGAVFYWTIGYRDSTSGQRERVSTIRFRRLPMWTEKEILRAKESGERLFKELIWD